MGVLESRHLGTHDLASIYSADPTGFFVGELNGEVISQTHISAIKYPSHSAFIGAFIVAKEHRGKRYGRLSSRSLQIMNLWVVSQLLQQLH